ncbi:MAG: copper-binding protein [Rhodoferax sp.]
MSQRTRSILIILLASAGLGSGAIAQTDHSSHGAMAAKQAPAEAAMAEGLVKKIDKAGKRVTIAHGALPNGMPAMTMAFAVKDLAWLDKMQVGQKIRFATDPADGMMVSRYETVK